MSSFFEKLKKGMGIKIPEKEESSSELQKITLKEKGSEKEESSEGQLAIDVYEEGEDFVIQSPIAGLRAEDLDISIENNVITIRGSRQRPDNGQKKYLYQECYWGTFSRKIILPEEIDDNRAVATMKDGILTLRIQKLKRKKMRKIEIKQIE